MDCINYVNITRCSNNYGPYHFPEKLIPLMISRALADMLDLGAGSGPMNHAFDLKDEWKEEA
mgnify:CR=1 FL=1